MAAARLVFETATNTYTAKKIIGQGGAGTVHLVEDVEKQEFALKCLRSGDSVKRKRFSNELNFCQKDVHPNIVRILDSGISASGEERWPFYVMPIYAGTLRTRMVAGIAPEEVLPLFDQVLSGVDAAHLRGVYHRDLKPENVLYDPNQRRLVVADFGIAHFEEEELLTAVETQQQERLANFTYSAPEQRVRGSAVDRRADIFALGLILNEMFTRDVPLAQGHPLVAAISPPHGYVDEIVGRMIRHSPADRYATVGSVKEELLTRGNAFIALQKFDEVRRKVVPAPTPDDPLGGQDIGVVSVDYDSGELVFGLKPSPPPHWREALLGIGDFQFYVGIEPSTVRFYGNKAGVRATEQTVTETVRFFKNWVASANRDYRRNIENEASKKHQARLRELAQELARAEEKARITQKLADLL